MPQTAAIPGAMFRVGVGVLPVPPRYYREHRCVPCSWAGALWRVLVSEARRWECRARRWLGDVRHWLTLHYAMALVDGWVPAGLLPLLARPLLILPPLPRRRVLVFLLIEILLLTLPLT